MGSLVDNEADNCAVSASHGIDNLVLPSPQIETRDSLVRQTPALPQVGQNFRVLQSVPKGM